MKASNIIWDTEGEAVELPEEISIPETVDIEDEDAVSDYITEITGFCHKGFVLSD